jgi:hypothetical protein
LQKGLMPPGSAFAASSVDHIVGEGEQHRRHLNAERLGGLEVDDEVEFRGLLDGKIGRLGALQNLVDLDGGTPEIIEE